MAIGKNVSRYLDALANSALDGETAAIDFRPHIFNDDFSRECRLDRTVFPAGYRRC